MQHQLYRELLVSDTIEYKKLCQVAVTRGVSHRITGHCVVASHISGNKAVFHTTVPCFRKVFHVYAFLLETLLFICCIRDCSV